VIAYGSRCHITIQQWTIGVVQGSVCGLERRHEAVADGLDLPALELGDQFAALGIL